MIPNPYKSKFIIFEGIDGSGKSEQYSRLQSLLKEDFAKVKVVYPKEPDFKRPVGKTIYQILLGEHPEYQLRRMQPYHFQAFYIEDRMSNYRQNIIPALQDGMHVIQDRGAASSICYGVKGAGEFQDLLGLHDRVFSAAQVPFIWPDLILIFDIPSDLAVKRMLNGGKKLDKFETKAKLSAVRKNYLAFAKKYPNCAVIDGTPDAAKVFAKTKKLLLPLLGL